MKPANVVRFFLALAAVVSATGAQGALVFSVFTDPHPTLGAGTIGFAYIGDGFVGSVQADGTGNVLCRTNLTGGGVAVFAPTVNIPVGSPLSEHYVSSCLGLGGFPSRDVYGAAANGIIHIDRAGLAGNQFITSVGGLAGSNLASAVRGILFEPIGTFGGDMLVTTIGGQVYRVTSTGATLLASTGEDTEGLDIAPLTVFGPLPGNCLWRRRAPALFSRSALPESLL